MNNSTNENTVNLTRRFEVDTSFSRSQFFLKFYPWFVMIFCSFFLFYKYILQVSPSVMTKELMSDFHMSGVALGNLAATYFYAYLVTQIFVGPLLDRYSPRYLTSFAILICALGALIFATTDTLYAAILARALMGAGTAFATVSYVKMSSIWFSPKKAAIVDGFLATAAMIGALCGQIPLTFLVTHVGWRGSILYCAIFGGLFALLFLLFITDKNKNKTTQGPLSAPIQVSDIVALLKDKKNWLLTFYSGLAFTPIAVLGGLWGNPYFEVAHHLSAYDAAFYTSLIFLGLAFGGPLSGYMASRVGQSLPVMITGNTIGLITLTIALYMMNIPLWFFGLCLFIFGLSTGVFVLSFPLGKELNNLRLAGTVVALINTGDALFGSFTEPLIGKVLDSVWDGKVINNIHYFSVANYHMALSLLPLYLFAALLCLLWLKKLKN